MATTEAEDTKREDTTTTATIEAEDAVEAVEAVGADEEVEAAEEADVETARVDAVATTEVTSNADTRQQVLKAFSLCEEIGITNITITTIIATTNLKETEI